MWLAEPEVFKPFKLDVAYVLKIKVFIDTAGEL